MPLLSGVTLGVLLNILPSCLFSSSFAVQFELHLLPTQDYQLATYPMPASLLIQSFDPGFLPVLPDGLEGEQGGQQAFDPGLRRRSSSPARAELQQEAPHSPSQALVGEREGELRPGWVSSRLPGCLPGSPQPQQGQRVLEQPSQHDEQGGEEESHQTQPAQLPVLHQRLTEPLISPGPEGKYQDCQSGQISSL